MHPGSVRHVRIPDRTPFSGKRNVSDWRVARRFFTAKPVNLK